MRKRLNHIKAFLTVLLLLSLGSGGCDSDEAQTQFENEAFSQPSGITETTRNREVVSEDEDDWRISPMYEGLIQFVDLPYPNPVQSGDVTFLLQAKVSGAVPGLRILGYNENRQLVDLLLPPERNTLNTGFHEYSFSPDNLSYTGNRNNVAGLHRIFIFDGNDNLVSYGDIEIQ